MDETLLFPVTAEQPAGPDWNKIKADYEAGSPSVREIAAREGISAIRKRAKAESWDAGSRQGSQSGSQPAQTTCEPQVRTIFTHVQIPEPDDDDFRWELDNPDVVMINTPSLAVYVNPYAKIVIRTESREYPEDDPYVCIDPRDVPALIERLRKLTGAAR